MSKIDLGGIKGAGNWTVVTAPVFVMDFTVYDRVHYMTAQDKVVKAPAFVFLSALVSYVPKAVLYFAWIYFSKCIYKTYLCKIRKT